MKLINRYFLSAFLLLSLNSSLLSATPELAKDINPGHRPIQLANGVLLGDVLVATGYEPDTGQEPYAVDTVTGDFSLLLDIYLGELSSNPRFFTKCGGSIYFNATTPGEGAELWKTDGSTANTVPVTISPAQLRPGSLGAAPEQLLCVLVSGNERLAFVATSNTAGREVFFLDPTSDTIVHNSEIAAGVGDSNPLSLTYIKDSAFQGLVMSASNGIDGSEPWAIRFPAFNEISMGDLNPSGSSFASNFVWLETAGKLIFTCATPSGNELCQFTPGAGPAALIKDVEPGSVGSTPIVVTRLNGSAALFVPLISSITGSEPYKTDGTSLGTDVVKDILPGGNSSSPADLQSINGLGVFSAFESASGRELYASDGTLAGTSIIKEFFAGPLSATIDNGFQPLGNNLYFSAGTDSNGKEVWRTNGTSPGTLLFNDFAPGPESSSPVFVGRDPNFLFVVTENDTAGELHSFSDLGVPESITQVPGFDPRSGNVSPFQVFDNGNAALFFAETRKNGYEPFMISDQGVLAIGDVVPGPEGCGSDPGASLPDGRAVFVGYTPATGSELWITDGTLAGTQLLKEFIPGVDSTSFEAFASAGDYVFFIAETSGEGYELWRTDGTVAGTIQVTTQAPGNDNGIGDSLVSFQGKVYFDGYSSSTGFEPYVSDGSTGGTGLVKDIVAGASESNPRDFIVFNNFLYFVATVGGETELFVSDGTSTGTQMIDMFGNAGNLAPNLLTVSGDNLFMTGLADGVFGNYELFVLTANASAPILVKEIQAGATGSFPEALTPSEAGSVVFLASNGIDGIEPYVSDGTVSGTFMLADLTPGAADSSGSSLGSAGGKAYLSIYTPTTGEELFESDGTVLGSQLIDINPGSNGSSLDNAIDFRGTFYFGADDGVHGAELFQIVHDSCPEDPEKTSPGTCGCGIADSDSDSDGILDCFESCDNDPEKSAPGVCGCGVKDIDSDLDGAFDCVDACQNDPAKTEPEACGCGIQDKDSDSDGALDCLEACPEDAAKTEPGICGCGIADIDANGNGVLDCQANPELTALALAYEKAVKKVPRYIAETKKQRKKLKTKKNEAKLAYEALNSFLEIGAFTLISDVEFDKAKTDLKKFGRKAYSRPRGAGRKKALKASRKLRAQL